MLSACREAPSPSPSPTVPQARRLTAAEGGATVILHLGADQLLSQPTCRGALGARACIADCGRVRELPGVPLPPSSRLCGSQGNTAPRGTREVLSTGVVALSLLGHALSPARSSPRPCLAAGTPEATSFILGGNVKDREAPHLGVQPQPGHRTPRHSCPAGQVAGARHVPPARPLGCRPHHTDSPCSMGCPPEACSGPQSRPGHIPVAGLGPGTARACTALTHCPCHTRSPGSC